MVQMGDFVIDMHVDGQIFLLQCFDMWPLGYETLLSDQATDDIVTPGIR